ncbi:hypothetical protein D3C85_885970 [compost metagenome]
MVGLQMQLRPQRPQPGAEHQGQRGVDGTVQQAGRTAAQQLGAEGVGQQDGAAEPEVGGRRTEVEFTDQGMTLVVDLDQGLDQGQQCTAVKGRQLRALCQQLVDWFQRAGLVLRQSSPVPVARTDAVGLAPAVELRITGRGAVDSGYGHPELGFEGQAVAAVVAVIAGKGVLQGRTVEPAQMVGRALVVQGICAIDSGLVVRQEGLAPGFVDRVGIVVVPAFRARLGNVPLLLLLLVVGITVAAIAAGRGAEHVGVAQGVLVVGVAHAEGVGVRRVTLFGLFGEGGFQVVEGKGDGVFALVADAFAVGVLHERVKRAGGRVAPGIELLGDADRVIQDHRKPLGAERVGGQARDHQVEYREPAGRREQLPGQGRCQRGGVVGDDALQLLDGEHVL